MCVQLSLATKFSLMQWRWKCLDKFFSLEQCAATIDRWVASCFFLSPVFFFILDFHVDSFKTARWKVIFIFILNLIFFFIIIYFFIFFINYLSIFGWFDSFKTARWKVIFIFILNLIFIFFITIYFILFFYKLSFNIWLI